MIDSLEIPKGSIPSSDTFLGKSLPLNLMPKFFSFQNDEVKFGLSALSKWAHAGNETETAGVLFEDLTGKLRFRDITEGGDAGVEIHINNLTHLGPDKARQELQRIAHVQSLYDLHEDRFVLLPEMNADDVPLAKEIHKEQGKKLYGSVHVHPSGNPPNGHDLALLLFDRADTGDSMKGVIAGDKHYIMAASKDTPDFALEATKDFKSTTMHDFAEVIDNETKQLIHSGIPTKSALMQSLIKACQLNLVGLYEGNVQTNIYRKIV
ncbi:MAG: hypothetical protein WAV51_02130 [Microgenomates group bacterium]